MRFVEDGEIREKEVPMLSALNLDLRDEYVADCANGVRRWNQALEEAGLDERQTHDVVLAASEAAANSVEHAYRFDAAGNVRLEAWANEGSVHVAVHDAGVWRAPARRSDRGRGRPIMEALMSDVTFDTENGGTVVRMRLPLTESTTG
jgi:anti-sigma regulatory factor (Ser/Thr protein kinase)